MPDPSGKPDHGKPDHTGRFSTRAAAYAGGRPGYPAALGESLRTRGLLDAGVADIGAGTGLFTRLLLEHAPPGATVTAVEPNDAMRAALDGPGRAGLSVRKGSAEHTGLPGASQGLITAAQAAHWFDPAPTAREFVRLLRPGGALLLVWNDWRALTAPGSFTDRYGEVVADFTAPGSSSAAVQSRVPEETLPLWFPHGMERLSFPNPLSLGLERLLRLAASVSYLPGEDDERFPALRERLERAFSDHQQGGEVTLNYVTHAFLGVLVPGEGGLPDRPFVP